MNPEISPWMAIADRQRYSDLKREYQQRQLKNMIRVNYQKQLTDQINQHKQMKLKEKQKQKQWQKNMINASIENQQKMIELEKMKAYASNQKQSRMDLENDYYKSAKKQREEFIEAKNRMLQNQLNRQAQQKTRMQMAQNERKKKQILQTLKQTMDDKQLRIKYNKLKQNQFENKKLLQNQILTLRQEQQRQKYLRKLKQRSLTIDYGSHQAFENNHKKTLVQRKKQQWERQNQYLRRAKQLEIYEQEFKRLKMGAQHQYRHHLQKQILQREENKRYNQRRQLQNDHQSISRYQNYSKSVDMQKKNMEDKNKKQLLEYLQRQVQEKKRLVKDPYLMKDRQIQLNLDLLQNSKGIIPGQTYELDPSRKRQLQTVAKSMAYSPSRIDKNYLAQRGKTILS